MAYLNDIFGESENEEFLLYIWDSVFGVLNKYNSHPSKKVHLLFDYYDELEGSEEGKFYYGSSEVRKCERKLFLSPFNKEGLFYITVTQYYDDYSTKYDIKTLMNFLQCNKKINNNLEKDIRKKIHNATIYIPDQKENIYEIVLQNLKVSIGQKSFKTTEKDKIRSKTPIIFRLVFQMMHVTALNSYNNSKK